MAHISYGNACAHTTCADLFKILSSDWNDGEQISPKIDFFFGRRSLCDLLWTSYSVSDGWMDECVCVCVCVYFNLGFIFCAFQSPHKVFRIRKSVSRSKKMGWEKTLNWNKLNWIMLHDSRIKGREWRRLVLSHSNGILLCQIAVYLFLELKLSMKKQKRREQKKNRKHKTYVRVNIFILRSTNSC